MIRLQQTLSNARMCTCMFLLNFCDQRWRSGIKASYFCKTFSSKKVVTVSQQKCFGFERIGISPIIDRSPSLRFSLPPKNMVKPPANCNKNGHSQHIEIICKSTQMSRLLYLKRILTRIHAQDELINVKTA